MKIEWNSLKNKNKNKIKHKLSFKFSNEKLTLIIKIRDFIRQ